MSASFNNAVSRIGKEDVSTLLAVNNASATETSELSAAGLERLIEQSFYAARIGADDAFIIVLDQSADYDNPNFRWFRSRYDRFAYVDRVVTAAHARRRGHARALYEAAIAEARAEGHHLIGCEVNVQPPNPGSEAFHRALGFVPVGEARLGPTKAVRYFALALDGYDTRL